LIVTGTNASRKAINDLVRKYRGLKGQGYKHTLLTRHDTTRMQRRHAKYYTVGDVVQPERHEVVVFTDNAQRLPDAVEREAYKGVAHDFVDQELQKTAAIMDFAKNTSALSTELTH